MKILDPPLLLTPKVDHFMPACPVDHLCHWLSRFQDIVFTRLSLVTEKRTGVQTDGQVANITPPPDEGIKIGMFLWPTK